MPRGHLTADGFDLGRWVSKQREMPERRSPEQIARLGRLGFIWDALAARWEEGFQHLQAYMNAQGHCLVPAGHVSEDGYRLDLWVGDQRAHQDSMSAEQKRRLGELGFTWDPFSVRWERGLSHLRAYADEHKHGAVPASYVTADGFRLGNWVRGHRLHAERLSEERRAILDALGFPWSGRGKIVRQTAWETMFSELELFKDRFGHCNVVWDWAGNPRLANWVATQRNRKKQGVMAGEQQRRLDALGFEWSRKKPSKAVILTDKS